MVEAVRNYPYWVCHSCGLKHGRRKPQPDETATYHLGTCGVCDQRKPVTEPRDFGHLNDTWKQP